MKQLNFSMINTLPGIGPIIFSGGLYFLSPWRVIIPSRWGDADQEDKVPGRFYKVACWYNVRGGQPSGIPLCWHLDDLSHLTGKLTDQNGLPENPLGNGGPRYGRLE